MYYKTSDKKAKLIEQYNCSPYVVGEVVFVPYNTLNKKYPNPNKSDTLVDCIIVAIDGDNLEVKESNTSGRTTQTITKTDIVKKISYTIGANPFAPESRIRNVNFSLDSVISGLNILGDKNRLTDKYVQDGIQIEEVNWNPFVYGKNNEPLYYQRPFVWTVEQNQMLIESIYLGMECGRILIRLRSFEEIAEMTKRGLTEIAFRDIVDGKQRLNALRGFMQDEYPDLHGNYYSDLSNQAQHNFTKHQLFAYCEMDENTPDDKVLEQFLRLNFAGVPQSPEHIEYVKGLRNLL